MPTKKPPRDAEPPLTGEDAAEGWENQERKREWFLQSRGLAGEASRTQLRLAAIAAADLAIAAPPPTWERPLRGPFDLTTPGATTGKAASAQARSTKAASAKAASAKATSASAAAKAGAALPDGALGPAVTVGKVSGDAALMLRIRVPPARRARVAPGSIRVFRHDPRQAAWRLVAESGFAADGGFAWVRLRRPGLYAAVGLRTGDAETVKARAGARAAARGGSRTAPDEDGGETGAEPPARQLAYEMARTRAYRTPAGAEVGEETAARAVPVARGARPPEIGWWKLGPRNINGRVKSLAIHPNDRNYLLAGSANGGVWRSTDAGATWNARWFGQLSMAVGAIAFAPSHPARVYAATGEDTPGWGPSYGGAGVYRSDDAGRSWALCDAGPGARSNKVLVHPADPDTLYVACDDGLWKSATGGIGVGNWVRKKAGHLTDALLDPTAPDTLYVAEWEVGLFKSTDGGDTWAPCNGTAGGASEVLPTGAAAEWPKLAMGLKGNHRTQYLAVKLGENSGKIYYSVNGARTWLRIPGTIQPASYNEWTNFVSVHPTHSKKMLAGAVGMSRTINRFTWNPTSGTHADHHQVVYDPVDPEICYAATDGGVYRSGDGGRTWALRSFGMAATQLYSLGVSQTGALVVGCGTQDQGIIGLRPGSELDWFDYHAGNEGGFFVVDPNANWNLYCTPWSHDLRRSTDGGATWTDIRGGMTKTFDGNPTPLASVSHLAVRPNHSNSLVAGGKIAIEDAAGTVVFSHTAIWRSLDQGDSWMARKLTEGDVTRVAFAPSDDRRCYAATHTGNFYRAKKSTYDWIKAHTNANKPADARVTGIGVSWTDAERVYVSLGGYGARRVMRSDDGGSHWADASGGAGAALPSIPVNSIAVDARDDDVVYAATDIGVFRSLDAGASWQDFNDGWAYQDVPRIIVTELVFRRAGSALYASTIGRGVYRRRV